MFTIHGRWKLLSIQTAKGECMNTYMKEPTDYLNFRETQEENNIEGEPIEELKGENNYEKQNRIEPISK